MNGKVHANLANDSEAEFPSRASTILRRALQDSSQLPLACPGVYDGLTARLALSQGFNALYMTGAGVSMSSTGMADLGLTTMTEMARTAGTIAQLDPSVPVIADADTGYGGTLNVARTVREYIMAGIAGFHLEDQVVNKRCGHLAGKQVVEVREYLSRIRAAVNMRKQMGSDIVIIARSDALAVTGFDDAITRLKAAVSVGADVVFLEAIHTREEAEKVCNIFNPMGVPVMYGMVQGSSAAGISVQEAREIGFSIIVYAGICLGPVVHSVKLALEKLQNEGDCDHGDQDSFTPAQVFKLCGLVELSNFDRQVEKEVQELLTEG